MSGPDRRRGRRPGTRTGARPARARTPKGRVRVGERFEAEVGPVAHGGHCVARLDARAGEDAGRVVFVRHALPGEQVVLVVTEGSDGDRFWRGDAVEVVVASADRVEAPCPYAGPGRCGGCDLQHVALPAQRDLKAAVVREQLARLAGLDVAVEVEAVPGDDEGLRWRTRHHYVDLPGGRRGMRVHRSHDVVEVADCLLDAHRTPSYDVGPHTFAVADGGFWQVHPGAPGVLVESVLAALAPRPGERALDLYAGVGLFGRFLADAVGDTELVSLVEADAEAARLSADNVPGAEVHHGPVEQVLASGVVPAVDLVVLDPPRTGARRVVVEQVVARGPRAVAYVACDPAALARDVATFAELGYELRSLRALDLFPMTHHVECVALLERNRS